MAGGERRERRTGRDSSGPRPAESRPSGGCLLLVFSRLLQGRDHEVGEIDTHDARVLGHGVTAPSVGLGVGVMAPGVAPVVGAEGGIAPVGTG
ncbi:MAG: hypothetical protein K0S37_2945 [Microbacterium sp.]|nr:hypothetical protein [Microbacterium sp.]